MKKKEPDSQREMAEEVLEKILQGTKTQIKGVPHVKVDDQIKYKDILSFAKDYVLPDTATPETAYIEKNNLQDYDQEIMYLYDKIHKIAEIEGTKFKYVVGNIIMQTDYWEPEHVLAPLEEKRFPDIATLIRAISLIGEDLYQEMSPLGSLPSLIRIKSDLVMCSGLGKIEEMLNRCQFADASTEVNRMITPGSPIGYGQPRYTQRFIQKTEE